MNMLEHYIEKVISVEKFIPPLVDNRDWVKVKMLVDCYGAINETEELFTIDMWEKIKQQGYYMA